ncbi:MAG: MarC family protein [Candidatus Pacearchaeota archaeon]|jgi:multiple antibiotic resistance protein
MELIDFALVLQIFALINPLSSFPILLSAYKNKMDVKKIAINAVVVAFFIALVIALIGTYLFNLFGVTLDSFRIAGGIILLLLGLDTVRSKGDKSEEYKNIGKMDSIISIIATPLLTGPATISFITIKTFEIGRVSIILDLLLAFILVAIVFIIFGFSVKRINPKVIDISSKVFGLFLTAVAIEMIVKGITGLLRI